MVENKIIKLGNDDNIVIRTVKYSSEKDCQQAVKDIKRVLGLLSEKSITEIISILAPYRMKFAKGEEQSRRLMKEKRSK